MDQRLMWDYYQNEASEVFAQGAARLRACARRVRPGGKVLNIGVGAGAFEDAARAMGLDVYSMDPDARAVEMLRRRHGAGEKARVGSGVGIPFPDAFFDAVVISEVIEHLTPEETARTLGEIARVLAPGGRIIGTVPSREDLKAQRVVCPRCGERFHRWGHLQRFDAPGIAALLSPRFRVEEVSVRPFNSWVSLNWKGKVIGLAKSLLRRLGVHGSNENILFAAVKRDG